MGTAAGWPRRCDLGGMGRTEHVTAMAAERPKARRRPRRKLAINASDLRIDVVPAGSIGAEADPLPTPNVCEALADAFWEWVRRTDEQGDDAREQIS